MLMPELSYFRWLIVFLTLVVMGTASYGADALEQTLLSTTSKIKQATPNSNVAYLEISSDGDCSLRINEARYGKLLAYVVRQLRVPAGSLQIECQAANRARALEKITLGISSQTALQLSISRFAVLTDQIVVDTVTGLQWTRSDSASFVHWHETKRESWGINWHDASAWCKSKGNGWRLPSRDELKSLVKDKRNDFILSGEWMWSSERDGPSKAWFVGLGNGVDNTDYIDSYVSNKALCVHSM